MLSNLARRSIGSFSKPARSLAFPASRCFASDAGIVGSKTISADSDALSPITSDKQQPLSELDGQTFQGTCRFFRDQKGYGFLNVPGRTEDIFVHHLAIVRPGYRRLVKDERVMFELKYENEQRRSAVNVRGLDGSPLPGLAKPWEDGTGGMRRPNYGSNDYSPRPGPRQYSGSIGEAGGRRRRREYDEELDDLDVPGSGVGGLEEDNERAFEKVDGHRY